MTSSTFFCVALVPSREIAALAVIVDAEAAVGFYRHYGFQSFVGAPPLLLLSVQTSAQMLSLAA